MLKSCLLVLCIVVFSLCNAQEFQPYIALDELPAAFDFSSENGMAVHYGTVYLVYTTLINEENAIIFARRPPGGVFSSQQLLLSDREGSLKGAPSIARHGQNLYVIYLQGSTTRYLVSSDDGENWTNGDLGLWSEVDWTANDPYPLLHASDTSLKAFSTKYDSLGGEYQYYTNTYQTQNQTYSYFVGADVVSGPVHFNSDIWVKQAGGGSNSGWPTFWGPVYTTGLIQSFSGQVPEDHVFRAGLYENVDPVKPTTDQIKQRILSNGQALDQHLGGGVINFLDVVGDTGTYLIGHVIDRRDSAAVYASYPPIPDTYLFRNNFIGADTVWVSAGQISMNQDLIFKNTLWLKGTFSGNRTIYCSDDMYLIGDILLEGTTPLQASEDNVTDRVTLISDKRIIIKYGYRDPIDSMRVHPNCGSDATGGIIIYADLIALNQHESNPRQDGVFTFEYQHPHPSTEAYVHEGILYDRIDLHRRRYPPTATITWPTLPPGSQVTQRLALDYPWYNPLWPERQPYAERGSIHLWGSLFQVRQGYVRRSGNDGEYPSNSGIWDIENDMCGLPISINWTESIVPDGPEYYFGKRNADGATGSGSGYKKNYHYDSRTNPASIKKELLALGVHTRSLDSDGVFPQESYHLLNESPIFKSMDNFAENYLYHMNNHLFDQNNELTQQTPENWMIKQARLLTADKTLQLWRETDAQNYRLMLCDHAQNQITQLGELESVAGLNSINRIGENLLVANYSLNNQNFELTTYDQNGIVVSESWWEDLPMLYQEPGTQSLKAAISVKPFTADSLYAIIWRESTSAADKQLYFAIGTLEPSSTPGETNTPLAITSSCYPNPFTERLSMAIQANKAASVKISVYNVKGQKLRSYAQDLSSGANTISWDGKDRHGSYVSNGIYFVKLESTDQSFVHKVLKIK